MKIGFFTDSYIPSADGVAVSVEACAKELQKLGHTVYIIAPSQPHVNDRKNVYRLLSVRALKTPEIWLALEVPQPLLFKISKLEFDIIHGHSGGPVSFLGWQLAALHHIPLVVTYHTMWRHYRHYFFYPPFLKDWMLNKITAIAGNDCDGVITPTAKAKKELISSGVKKPIYIVPGGIYLEKYNLQKKGYLYKKLNLPLSKKIILTIGRLEKEKSLDFLIKSFAIVRKKRPDTVLVIIGEGRDKEKLKALATRLNLENAVYFAGVIPHTEIPKAYADANIFVFSSQTETQGLVIVEAMASGLPVIAVEDPAFDNVILDGKNGYLVKKDNDLFAQKIINLLTNEARRIKFRTNAQKTAEQFSIHHTARVLEQTYIEIIFNKYKTRENTKLKFHKKINNTMSTILKKSKNLSDYKNLEELLKKLRTPFLSIKRSQ